MCVSMYFYAYTMEKLNSKKSHTHTYIHEQQKTHKIKNKTHTESGIKFIYRFIGGIVVRLLVRVGVLSTALWVVLLADLPLFMASRQKRRQFFVCLCVCACTKVMCLLSKWLWSPVCRSRFSSFQFRRVLQITRFTSISINIVYGHYSNVFRSVNQSKSSEVLKWSPNHYNLITIHSNTPLVFSTPDTIPMHSCYRNCFW